MSPFDLPWPRETERAVVRLLMMDDVEAMLSYRSMPEVCRYLNHDVLDRAAVEDRIRSRLPEGQAADAGATCGLAVEVDGQMVGDAMLRTIPADSQVWIGFGFHPRVWGRGLATEVATELVHAVSALNLTVMADAFVDNHASQKVLVRAGLVKQGTVGDPGSERAVFVMPART